MDESHHQAQREETRDPPHGAQHTRATGLLTMQSSAGIFRK